MPEEVVSFTIDADIPSSNLEDLLGFIHQDYILSLKGHFTNVRRLVIDNDQVLDFTALGPKGSWQVEVEVKSGRPIQVKMTPCSGAVPQAALDQLRDDLVIAVGLYEERVRGTTLHFAWVMGEKGLTVKEPLRRRRIAGRIFFENMYFLYVILIAISIIVFIILGSYTPIVLVVGQFVLVLFSDKIIARMGEWPVTAENHLVYLLKYHLSVEEFQAFQQKYSRDLLLRIKSELYEETLAIGKPIDCETASKVFSKYGFNCKPDTLSTKTVDVHEIVKKVSRKFSLPMPKVVIANTMLPNAAASGPSPSHGIVLITTGLLVRLDDNELLSVVGHEFSHLKARDPLVLLGIISTEYLLRVYLFWPFIAYFGLLYLLFSLGMVFFIAKFFEARADLDSAMRIGQPKILAGALKKIGYRRLQSERNSASKIQSWINWNPHPPIYFRISRLETLESSKRIKHTLIRSIIDNFRGFWEALH